jgi:hypothetical protein
MENSFRAAPKHWFHGVEALFPLKYCLPVGAEPDRGNNTSLLIVAPPLAYRGTFFNAETQNVTGFRISPFLL